MVQNEMSRKKVKKAIHSIKKEISRPAKAKKVLSKIWWGRTVNRLFIIDDISVVPYKPRRKIF